MALLLTSPSNSTSEIPDYIGFSAAGIAVVFYGSNFVPVKKFDTQDGLAFQFFLCTAIWLVGLAVNAARSFPQMHPLVMIGGAVWATGNLCVVPIIQTIGLGLGILIWGTVNMLSGWASGRFGWFDIPPQVPGRPTLNYIGVALSVIASTIVFFVNPATVHDEHRQAAVPPRRGSRPSVSDQDASISVYDDAVTTTIYPSVNESFDPADSDRLLGSDDPTQQVQQALPMGPFWLRMSPLKKKIFGISLALASGPAYGLAFVPTYYVQNHTQGASQNGLDYVFSHFTGILCASSIYFSIYSAISRNRPSINPRIALPAFASGAMWGIAAAAWFLANQVLSEAVAFPIITTAPIVVAACWSVFVFREIQGARNLLLLSVTFAATVTGSVLNGMSK